MNPTIYTSPIKLICLLAFAILFIVFSSCNNDDDIVPTIDPNLNPIDTLINLVDANDILFNIPIENDTILVDKDYNIDFRIEIEGHLIDTTFITLNDDFTLVRDTFIISTRSMFQTSNTINLKLRAINAETGAIVYFETGNLKFKVVEDLSKRYISETIDDGKLKLTWPELDKNNTNSYLIERYIEDNLVNTQEFEVQDSIYIDNVYVGEEATFKISVINNDENKQDIWHYNKPCEPLTFTFSQHETEGYNVHFSKNKYYNAFDKYDLTSGPNFDLVYTTNNINDTVFHFSSAKFGDPSELGLRSLPVEYPQGVSDEDWMFYNKWLIGSFGNSSFDYDLITGIDSEYLAYTLNGNIFKHHINSNQTTDAIINESANYGFLRSSPKGDYLYAKDQNIFGSPTFFWTSDNLTEQPIYTFDNGFVVPQVSDNLIAISSVPNTNPTELALYNVVTGDRIFTTPYNATSNGPTMSSNGQNFFINDSDLRLCSYTNNTFTVIWEEADFQKFYRFYDFSPLNDNICFTWDDDKIFSTRNVNDFSEINSFPLELAKLISIDYSTRKIMGYVTDKILIYNLDSGALEKEIPVLLFNLFNGGNNSILIGNTIYNNRGIKYNLD